MKINIVANAFCIARRFGLWLTIASVPQWIFAENRQATTDLLSMSLDELMQIKVTTASRKSEDVATAPSSVIVVSKDQIKKRGYRNLQDLLQDLVAVDLQRASSATSYNNIAIRGLSGNSKFLILLDGVRISSPTGEDIPVAQNFPLGFVKQVEIIQGPGSALYGADGMSAVINLISRDDYSDNNTELKLESGSDGYRQYSLNGAWEITDKLKVLLAIEDYQLDGEKLAREYGDVYQLTDLVDFSGQTVVEASQRGTPKFPVISKVITSKWIFSDQFSLLVNHSEFEHPTSTGTKPQTVNYDRNPVWSTQLDNVSLGWSKESDSFSQNYHLNYSVYELAENSKFSNIFVGFLDGYKYARGEKQGLTADFVSQISPNTSFSYGLIIDTFESIPKTADLPSKYDTDRDFNEQNLNYLFVGDLPIKIFKIKWNNYGGYVQLKRNFGQNLELTTGLRYDNNTIYNDSLNPRLGLVYQPTNNQIWKILYGEAFLAPTPRFTHDHFGSFSFQRNDGLFQSFFMQIPNESLKPEKLRNFEISYLNNIAPNASIDFSLFHSKLNNFIDRRITDSAVSDFIDGGYIATTQIFDNTGELTVKGAEFGLDMQFATANGMIDTKLAIARHFGSFDNLGQAFPIPYTAPWKLNLNLGYNTDYSQHFISLIWRDKTPNNANQFIDSTTQVSWFSGFEFENSPLSIQLRIDNLLNSEQYSAGEASSSVLTKVPQEKRRVDLGVTLQW